MPVDWNQVRSEFPALERWTFLNTAEFGQLPKSTVDAVASHFAHRDELACSDFLTWFDDADRVRESIAELIHCSADDIAFVPNACTGLSLFLNGIPWKRGDRILTLRDEFPNNLYFPALLANRGVEFVECEWDELFDSVTPATQAVVLSTCNYTNGFRPPLEELSTFLREHRVRLYVDGTQSLGALRFDTSAIRPDMFAVHGYKWLLCPNGAAFLYVDPELRRLLAPQVVGWRSDRNWRSVANLHHGAPQFTDKAEKYEGGMLDFPAIYAMGASVGLFLELGPAEIEERVLQLADSMADLLESHGGQIQHRGSPIIAARFEGTETRELASRLKQRGILVSARHGNLRVSVHLYNNEQDLARLDEALKQDL